MEKRQHNSYGYESKFGRSSYLIECPFCGIELKVYKWSIAGKGKKCICGAMHFYSGMSEKNI
jgi:hypothetical protein